VALALARPGVVCETEHLADAVEYSISIFSVHALAVIAARPAAWSTGCEPSATR
jgi:hypothetical protein